MTRAALVVAAALTLTGCLGGEGLRGTVLDPVRPAPAFELTNQHGETVALSARLGAVVAVTFLYTECPDICPVIASHMREMRRLLGEDAAEVEIVAISVDPDRDSVEAAHDYSRRWDMLEGWDFLVGDEAELRPVWRAYYVAPSIDPTPADGAATAAPKHTSGTDALARDIAAAYTVSHAGPVYLVDRGGGMRSLFTLPFEPTDVVHDVRVLLAEGPTQPVRPCILKRVYSERGYRGVTDRFRPGHCRPLLSRIVTPRSPQSPNSCLDIESVCARMGLSGRPA